MFMRARKIMRLANVFIGHICYELRENGNL